MKAGHVFYKSEVSEVLYFREGTFSLRLKSMKCILVEQNPFSMSCILRKQGTFSMHLKSYPGFTNSPSQVLLPRRHQRLQNNTLRYRSIVSQTALTATFVIVFKSSTATTQDTEMKQVKRINNARLTCGLVWFGSLNRNLPSGACLVPGTCHIPHGHFVAGCQVRRDVGFLA